MGDIAGMGADIFESYVGSVIATIAIGATLAITPEFIANYPVLKGLDPVAIKEFRDLLFRLNGQGTSLIISSHSISEVEKLCHRVGILSEGRLVRIVAHDEWQETGLENLFVETVKKRT